jgi:Domain of unknown function (DUF4169)
MAEIVNLRIARKRRTNAQAEAIAVANRVAFGVSKDLKNRGKLERALAESRLEAHKRLEPGAND